MTRESRQHIVAIGLLLGLLKELTVKRRDDLKIIIMSAAADADLVVNFSPRSVLERDDGREHKVLVSYLPEPPEEDTIVETLM